MKKEGIKTITMDIITDLAMISETVTVITTAMVVQVTEADQIFLSQSLSNLKETITAVTIETTNPGKIIEVEIDQVTKYNYS